MEFTLLFAALTGVLAGWTGLKLWDGKLPDRAADRLIGAALTGLIAGRLTAMVVQGVNPLTHPGDFIIVRGGVSTVAAAIGFTGYLIWSNRTNLRALDELAPSVALALAGWHAGCLWRDACLGTPSELPWAWAQSGSAVTRHPVEIYAALMLVAAAILISRLPWRAWLRFGAGFCLIALVRLATEPIRPNLDGGPVIWYAIGVATGIALILAGSLAFGNRQLPST